jgi:hypothetical protein
MVGRHGLMGCGAPMRTCALRSDSACRWGSPGVPSPGRRCRSHTAGAGCHTAQRASYLLRARVRVFHRGPLPRRAPARASELRAVRRAGSGPLGQREVRRGRRGREGDGTARERLKTTVPSTGRVPAQVGGPQGDGWLPASRMTCACWAREAARARRSRRAAERPQQRARQYVVLKRRPVFQQVREGSDVGREPAQDRPRWHGPTSAKLRRWWLRIKSPPLKSGLLLQDGKLSIEDILRLRLPQAMLAYLSACQTAKGDNNAPDQAIHLAASMLFSGFRSVIGTMW